MNVWLFTLLLAAVVFVLTLSAIKVWRDGRAVSRDEPPARMPDYAPPSNPGSVEHFCYAVSHAPDGAVELTVYEDGFACCTNLTQPQAAQLAGLLTRRGQ